MNTAAKLTVQPVILCGGSGNKLKHFRCFEAQTHNKEEKQMIACPCPLTCL